MCNAVPLLPHSLFHIWQTLNNCITISSMIVNFASMKCFFNKIQEEYFSYWNISFFLFEMVLILQLITSCILIWIILCGLCSHSSSFANCLICKSFKIIPHAKLSWLQAKLEMKLRLRTHLNVPYEMCKMMHQPHVNHKSALVCQSYP